MNKLKMMLCLCIVGLTIYAQAQTPPANSIVAKHGMLKVVGSHVVNKNNEKISLAGNSLFWSNYVAAKKFYNDETVKILAQEWNSSIVRAAMGATHSESWAPHENGYVADLANGITEEKDATEAVIEAAIKYGIYVIIDWHSHEAEQSWNKTKAIEFFTEMADKYGHHDNVIYEIYNEPINTPWPTIKSYAEDVIDAIRSKDPDNLIIVGTRTWSQRVEEASLNQIDDVNVAYTLHFYAAAPYHRQNLRDEALRAMNNGIAIFVTEWGMSEAGGGGSIDYEATKDWMDFFKANYISHVNWSISDVHESSAALNNSAGMEGLRTDNLRPAGIEAKKIIKNWNVTSPPTGGNSVSWDTPPTSISNGNNPITLEYSIDQNGLVLVQLFDTNWNYIGQVYENVSAGTGTLTLPLNVSGLSTGNYRIQIELRNTSWSFIDGTRSSEEVPFSGTPPPSGNSLSWDTTPTSISNGDNQVTLDYSIGQNGLVLVQLFDTNWNYIGQVYENVSSGSGQSTLTLNVNGLSAGNYRIQIELRNASWSFIDGTRSSEEVPFTGTPPPASGNSLSWDTTPTSISNGDNQVTLVYSIEEAGILVAQLYSGWNYIGQVYENVSAGAGQSTLTLNASGLSSGNYRIQAELRNSSWTVIDGTQLSQEVSFNGNAKIVSDLSQNIHLSPNPANQSIQLTYELSENTQAQIQIYDAFGKLVKHIKEVEILANSPTNLDVSQLPAGMYFYNLQSDKWQAVKKFVIAR